LFKVDVKKTGPELWRWLIVFVHTHTYLAFNALIIHIFCIVVSNQ